MISTAPPIPSFPLSGWALKAAVHYTITLNSLALSLTSLTTNCLARIHFGQPPFLVTLTRRRSLTFDSEVHMHMQIHIPTCPLRCIAWLSTIVMITLDVQHRPHSSANQQHQRPGSQPLKIGPQSHRGGFGTHCSGPTVPVLRGLSAGTSPC